MPRAASWVALLRGVNVGGNNKLPMKELAAMFVAAGCDDVATFIQSGNVVFRAPSALAARVPKVIGAAIEARFGFASPVIVRSAAELRAAIEHNPFVAGPGVEEDRVYLGFLSAMPDAKAVAALDPARSPPDRFVVRGREIYLAIPNGMARTKLTNAYFDAKLGVVSTFRNLRTAAALLAKVEA